MHTTDYERWRLTHPPIMGGAPGSPTTYPLDAPVIDGTEITMDQYLQQPVFVTRKIAQLAMQKMYANRIFSPGPEVVGGAVLFERPNPLLTDLYAGRDLQEMAPGTEAPVLTFNRGVPMVTTPREIGGKMEFTKQEQKRNNPILIENAITQAGNTLIRKVETMALAELNAVIASETRTTSGQSWSAAAAEQQAMVTKSSQPLADFLAAQTFIELEERGHTLNGAILHPTDWLNLSNVYGVANVGNVLESAGITEYYVTPRQTQGKVKLYEAGQVGLWSNEFPLDQTSEIDLKRDKLWWYEWTISPLFAVTDQYAMVEMDGIS